MSKDEVEFLYEILRKAIAGEVIDKADQKKAEELGKREFKMVNILLK